MSGFVSCGIMFALGQEESDQRRGSKEKAGLEERLTIIADFGEKTKEDGAAGCDDAAEVVTEPGAGGAEEGRKERRQAHGKEPENPWHHADEREPDAGWSCNPIRDKTRRTSPRNIPQT